MIGRTLVLALAFTASATAAQGPAVDTLLECSLRPAAQPGGRELAADSSGDEPRRIALLLKGERISSLDPGRSGLVGTNGNLDVFWNGGTLVMTGRWPERLEVGAVWGGPGYNREYQLLLRDADLRRRRVHATVTVSEFVHGSDGSVVIGGYAGPCSIVQGRAAGRRFEDLQ